MRSPRRLFGCASAAVLVVSFALSYHVFAQSNSAPAKKSALLIRGTFAQRGLPFFGPNAIQSLSGEYLLGDSSRDQAAALKAAQDELGQGNPNRINVWYTREQVVLSSEWKSTVAPGMRILSRPEGRPGIEVLFVKGEGYSLFLECKAVSAEIRAFALALNRKFSVFFGKASNDTELSFPALVEY
jgi:hypothetical protein